MPDVGTRILAPLQEYCHPANSVKLLANGDLEVLGRAVIVPKDFPRRPVSRSMTASRPSIAAASPRGASEGLKTNEPLSGGERLDHRYNV